MNVKGKTIKLIVENKCISSIHWVRKWFLTYDTRKTNNKRKNS